MMAFWKERNLTILLMLAFLLTAVCPLQVGAINPQPEPPGIQVFIDGNPLQLDVAPVLEQGRTLVPLRAIFEALGAEVDWDPDQQRVAATKGSLALSLQIGSRIAWKNGIQVELDVPAKLVASRTLVPLRFVGEALGAEVVWDGETRRVDIASGGAQEGTLPIGDFEGDPLPPIQFEISPNFAKNKIIPAGTGSELGLSKSLNFDLKKELISSLVIHKPEPDSPGFPLTSADRAGVKLLGRGYNIITGKYADSKSVKEPMILDIKKLLDDKRVYEDDVSSSDSRYISGESAWSYSKEMATSVGASGNYLFFGGSVKTNFASSSLTESNRAYATLTYVAPQYRLHLRDQNIDFKNYMTADFKDALVHMPPVQLFETYGTHVLRSVIMGGRLDYNATTDSTYNKSSSSLETDVKASFNAMFASAGVSVQTSETTTSTNYYQHSQRNIKAYPAYGATDLAPAQFSQWFASLQNQPAFCDFGQDPLIPIWELGSGLITGLRTAQLSSAYAQYAESKNYIPAENTWGINGIRLYRYTWGQLKTASNLLAKIEDPVTGDIWELVGNISPRSQLNDNNDRQDYIYVRYGWSNDTAKPPVVGVFMTNWSQGEDPVKTFNQLYGNDPTAELWTVGDSGGSQVHYQNQIVSINHNYADNITLHYVTSRSKETIKRLRVRFIWENGSTHYYPGDTPALRNDTTFLPVWDVSHNKAQHCNDGALAVAIKNRFIEYSYESP